MNNKEKSRYARQLRLKHVGEVGQQKLLDSTALIIGMGGLGSPAAMYLVCLLYTSDAADDSVYV